MYTGDSVGKDAHDVETGKNVSVRIGNDGGCEVEDASIQKKISFNYL